jgi:hypothetical protein
MDIEMINKFLKIIISAVILSASGYANIASADVILTEYEWNATCYDCANGPDDPTLWIGVTGSITLSDYTLGDDITSANFISFAYTGVSQFLPMFTVGTGESFDFTTQAVSGKLYANADLTLELEAISTMPPPSAPTYSDVPTIENLVSDYDPDFENTYNFDLQACIDLFYPGTGYAYEGCNDLADNRYRTMINDISDAKYIINSAIYYNNNLKAQYENEKNMYINVLQLSVAPSEISTMPPQALLPIVMSPPSRIW